MQQLPQRELSRVVPGANHASEGHAGGEIREDTTAGESARANSSETKTRASNRRAGMENNAVVITEKSSINSCNIKKKSHGWFFIKIEQLINPKINRITIFQHQMTYHKKTNTLRPYITKINNIKIKDTTFLNITYNTATHKLHNKNNPNKESKNSASK